MYLDSTHLVLTQHDSHFRFWDEISKLLRTSGASAMPAKSAPKTGKHLFISFWRGFFIWKRKKGLMMLFKRRCDVIRGVFSRKEKERKICTGFGSSMTFIIAWLTFWLLYSFKLICNCCKNCSSKKSWQDYSNNWLSSYDDVQNGDWLEDAKELILYFYAFYVWKWN